MKNSHLKPWLASSTARLLNSVYIFLLKFSLRKKDQNLKSVFISWDWPLPRRFLSAEKWKKQIKHRNLHRMLKSYLWDTLRGILCRPAVWIHYPWEESVTGAGKWAMTGARYRSWWKDSSHWGWYRYYCNYDTIPNLKKKNHQMKSKKSLEIVCMDLVWRILNNDKIPLNY